MLFRYIFTWPIVRFGPAGSILYVNFRCKCVLCVDIEQSTCSTEITIHWRNFQACCVNFRDVFFFISGWIAHKSTYVCDVSYRRSNVPVAIQPKTLNNLLQIICLSNVHRRKMMMLCVDSIEQVASAAKNYAIGHTIFVMGSITFGHPYWSSSNRFVFVFVAIS